jgi:hypothetical protein
MIDWSKGLSAETYVMVVDPGTWKDIERLEITGGSISRQGEGLRNSADISFVRYDQMKERYIRVYLDAKQRDAGKHVALFTGLACSPDRNILGSLVTNSVQCNSVLQPCQDILLPRGWYAPAGALAETVIRDLLSATPAPVRFDGVTPSLLDHIVAEDGETRLTMVEKVLLAIGWRMQIAGDGTIRISEPASEPVAMFDSLERDVIETELTVEYDWYTAPNVFRASTDTDSYTAVDDSDSSPLSTVSRGREIWMEETGVNLSDGETLQSYAERRLKEEQAVSYRVSYKRRYDPEVLVSDRVRIHYPAQGIGGEFRVVSQSIELGYGVTTSEEVIAI